METNSSSNDECMETEECMEETGKFTDEIKEPEVGMEFDSIDEYREFYFSYGDKKGFPVKVRSSVKGDNGEVRFVTLSCSRTGFTKSCSKNALKLHPTTKTGCKAKIRAALCPDGKWRVKRVSLDHNHVLSPGKFIFYRKNRIMSKYVKRRLEIDDRAGTNRPNKNLSSFLAEAGGHENVPFSQEGCCNYLDRVRPRLRLGDGDAMALQNYFQRMQANNANFFYLMDLDDEGRLRNVFWADARSKAAYEEFGDAVTFDTTYLTNKYDVPFAPFVGVNHHGQSCLLGCGLISSEDIDSFTWLFRSWLSCMNGRAPTAIITDQDNAMKRAIEIVFPNTRHRWCLWHIMKKLPEKLSGYNQYESIKFAMQNAVYDSLTCEEFEGLWSSFIEKFKLQENDWLNGLFDERSCWVPVFLKDTFWAGMSSSQRSESMKAFFDGYVNSKTTLKQFVEQYENALRSKVQKENVEDFNSFDRSIPCITDYPLEKQFQQAYTTSKFKEFQEEIRGKLYCAIYSVKEECGFQVYDVTQDILQGPFPRRATFRVCFQEEDCDIKCNCQLFEFRGIICRHALTVLLHKLVYRLPDKFIIRRWRKDVKRCHEKVKIIYSDWTINPESERFDRMCNAFYEAADLATENEDKTNKVTSWIRWMVNELKKNDGTCGSNPSQVEHVSGSERTRERESCIRSTNICSSLSVHRKGRPLSKRLKSTIENVVRNTGEKKKKVKEKGINLETASHVENGSQYTTAVSEDILAHDSPDLNMQAEVLGIKQRAIAVPVVGGFYSREVEVPVVPSVRSFPHSTILQGPSVDNFPPGTILQGPSVGNFPHGTI